MEMAETRKDVKMDGGTEIDFSKFMDLSLTRDAAGRLYDKISSLIMDGTITQGYLFPNETVFCRQLGVGRSTLREAYKMLESYGFITRTKKGTVVNARKEILASVPVKQALKWADRKEFTVFRIMLESENAYLASQNAGSKEIKLVEQVLSGFGQALEKGGMEEMLEQDMSFHVALSEITGSELMVNMMKSVSEVWRENIRENFLQIEMDSGELAGYMALQHQEIYKAVKDRNPKKARVLMIRHIQFMSGYHGEHPAVNLDN